MAIKFVILCGLFAIALGFTLPEDHFDGPNNYYEVAFGEPSPLDDGEVLVRNARSPQRTFEARGEHHSRLGDSANLIYNHPINKDFTAYAKASRNFRFNENQGHVGLKYHF